MDRLENAGLICPQCAAALENKHHAFEGKNALCALSHVFRRRNLVHEPLPENPICRWEFCTSRASAAVELCAVSSDSFGFSSWRPPLLPRLRRFALRTHSCRSR
jgi:hypothetical protein